MEGKSRDEIKEERQRKKAEAALRKAQKKAENPSPQQQQSSKSQPPKEGNKENPSLNKKTDLKIATTENSLPQEPKSVLKQISPIDLKEKSNLKVRFDLQPGNNLLTPHERKRPKSKFLLATPTNVHPAFRRLAARCDANKLSGLNELLYEFHGTLIEFIKDYSGESDCSYKASLKTAIQPQLNCLSDNSARPFP